MAVDPRVEVCLIETPTFVEADLSKPVADHFLFEAIAREAAIFCGLVEVENTFFRQASPSESFKWSATALANAGRLMKSDVFVCIPDSAPILQRTDRNPIAVPIPAFGFLISSGRKVQKHPFSTHTIQLKRSSPIDPSSNRSVSHRLTPFCQFLFRGSY